MLVHLQGSRITCLRASRDHADRRALEMCVGFAAAPPTQHGDRAARDGGHLKELSIDVEDAAWQGRNLTRQSLGQEFADHIAGARGNIGAAARGRRPL